MRITLDVTIAPLARFAEIGVDNAFMLRTLGPVFGSAPGRELAFGGERDNADIAEFTGNQIAVFQLPDAQGEIETFIHYVH